MDVRIDLFWSFRGPYSYLACRTCRRTRSPRLGALLKDPANNAPLPIVNWDLEKMLAELRAPDEP